MGLCVWAGVGYGAGFTLEFRDLDLAIGLLWIVAAIATMIAPQLGLVLAPIMVAILLWHRSRA